MTSYQEMARRMEADKAREEWFDNLAEQEHESELAEKNRWRHAMATRAADPIEPPAEYGFTPPWAVDTDG